MSSLLHFCSDAGWFGDPMPLFAEGIYHIYYTKRRKDESLSWGHLSTEDFYAFTEHIDPIEPGPPGTLDCAGLMTGSVIYEEGVYHLFYAGRDARGKCHMLSARSDDGIHFEKEYRPLFEIDASLYRPDGTWRDPCVVKVREGEYWMVFCARRPEHLPDPFPSALGLAVSEDLVNWTLRAPLDFPSAGTSAECPDLFYMGDRWAMIYYWHDTRIRFAESPEGPYFRQRVQSPNHFDFMAAKRMDDGRRQVLIGWIPRKDCDCAERIWGGNMAWPRELYIDDQGQPACRFIGELQRHFGVHDEMMALSRAVHAHGDWSRNGDGASLKDGCIYFDGAPDAYRLRFTMELSGAQTTATLLLRAHPARDRGRYADALNEGYQLIFDLPGGRLRLREHYQWDQRPDLASIQLNWTPGRAGSVDLLLNGDILEVVIDERQSLVCRLMKREMGELALIALDGTVKIGDWSVHRPEPRPEDGPRVPGLAGQYVPVYRPEAAVFSGPDSENYRAGRTYEHWVPNDFAVAECGGRWHLIGITHPLPDGYRGEQFDPKTIHEAEWQLFHAVSEPGGLESLMRPDSFSQTQMLLPASERPGERREIYAPAIGRTGDRYTMIYSPDPFRRAVSEDLLTWCTAGFAFDGGAEGYARDPNLWLEDGEYRVTYLAQEGLCLRRSADLIRFGEPVLIRPRPEGVEMESPVLLRRDGYYYLFYCEYAPKLDVRSAYGHVTRVIAARTIEELYDAPILTTLPAHAPEIVLDDSGEAYIFSAEWPCRGVSMARLRWV